MQYAFRALAQRALTEQELRTRLARRDVSTEEAERVISRLRELGYLDDTALARAASDRRGVGASRIRFDLKRRGVDRQTVDAALLTRDPEQERNEAAQLVERNRERWLRARDPRARAYGFLARRGFSPDVIWSVLRALESEANEL